MEIIPIAVIAIVSTILIAIIKFNRPEIAILISAVTGVIIFSKLFPYLESILSALTEISNETNIDLSFIDIVFKVIGIAYICEFSSHICKDAGENAISSKVELAGKILILFVSAPVILALLELLSNII